MASLPVKAENDTPEWVPSTTDGEPALGLYYSPEVDADDNSLGLFEGNSERSVR